MQTFSGFIGILIFLGLYFLPSIIASNRHHKQTTAITVLNLFLGITGIGWVVALIWAFTKD